MKTLRWVLLTLYAAVVAAVAQPPAPHLATTSTNASSLRYGMSLAPLIQENAGLKPQDSIRMGRLQLRGPLVRPAKGENLWDVPVQLLRMFNPFAPTESRPQPETLPLTKGESLRAWTTTVGWHPGSSAFPDPPTGELGLTLATLRRASVP